MTCREFTDLTLEELASPAALEHAASCESCNASLERQRRVADALRALAHESAAAVAAPEVEANLLRAFREASPKVVPIRRRPPLWTWAALAATAAMVVAAVRLNGPATVVAPPSIPAPPVAVSVPPPMPNPVRAPAPVTTVARVRRPARAASPRREVPPKSETATDFIPLPYAGRVMSEESLDVIRVRMPRSAMARFGLPINAERALEPVSADIVFGQDGIARAIRFTR